MFQLQADVEDLAHGLDGTYLLTLYLQNVDPEQEHFVMAPSVRAYLQVERRWEEVPLRSRDGQEGRVGRGEGKQTFGCAFRADVRNFEELLPGTLRVRFASVMAVACGGEPTEGLFERTDGYYVYLKPHGADDVAILRKTKHPGKPLLWIPMPSH